MLEFVQNCLCRCDIMCLIAMQVLINPFVHAAVEFFSNPVLSGTGVVACRHDGDTHHVK